MKKVVLAYSGGLDTTCCVHWLKSKGFSVVCFSADLGSEFSPQDLKRRARKSGASKIYIKDLKAEFASGYILPSLRASAIYQDKYTLGTALGRPLIAKYLIETARKEKAKFVAHGCTAKGNDQVRLEVSAHILDKKIKVIAPLREWKLLSREDEIEYAKKHKLPVKITKEKSYSIDKNIWGVSIEGGALENLAKEPPGSSYYSVKSLKTAGGREVNLTVKFKHGIPVRLNGRRITLVNLIERLNRVGGQCGVGRTDSIEDRVIGIKSRELYEAPAAWILHLAHKELESLTLDRETRFYKELLSQKYAWLVYQGLWFTALRKSLDRLIENTQKKVSGKVALKLYKGNIVVAKRFSPNSLYKRELATYGRKDKFNRKLAEGFIKLWEKTYTG